jgi:hypothetical protein
LLINAQRDRLTLRACESLSDDFHCVAMGRVIPLSQRLSGREQLQQTFDKGIA